MALAAEMADPEAAHWHSVVIVSSQVDTSISDPPSCEVQIDPNSVASETHEFHFGVGAELLGFSTGVRE